MKILKSPFSNFKTNLLVCCSVILLSCQNDDNGGNVYSNLQYNIDNIVQPVNDFHGFLDSDSSFIISAFSAKIPVVGLEDEIEEIYSKQNLKIKLEKLNEGNFSFSNQEVTLQIDTLYYSYSSTPYRIGTLIPEFDSVEAATSLLYVKQIISGENYITGNFDVTRLVNVALPGVDSNIAYQIEGDFINLPFTEK